MNRNHTLVGVEGVANFCDNWSFNLLTAMKNLLIFTILLICFFGLSYAQRGIAPSTDFPGYWSVDAKPVMLIGGSIEDNLFQFPNLEAHLDSLADAGGNYVRNTMSSRDQGNVWPFAKTDSLYDLNVWNDEYWSRFENFLRLTAERNIIVQLEVWATFDFYRENWNVNPFNPKNNKTYGANRTKLPLEVRTHPIYTENDFFRSVPTQLNNAKVLEWQQKFVDKLLEHSLKFDHILYCMDNETSVPSNWGLFWARYIINKGKEAGKYLQTTEMWDPWDLSHPMHDETLLNPQYFSFVDISQNNHNSGDRHWQVGRKYIRRMEMLGLKRPVNNIKIYGGNGRFGSSRDGVERFWRSAFLGAASVRFHRPPSGNGLNAAAQASIRSLRMLFDEIPFYRCQPLEELLSDRHENEAFAFGAKGEAIAIYFPDGGEISLNAADFGDRAQIRWLSVEASSWGTPETLSLSGNKKMPLSTPGKGHWVCLLQLPT